MFPKKRVRDKTADYRPEREAHKRHLTQACDVLNTSLVLNLEQSCDHDGYWCGGPNPSQYTVLVLQSRLAVIRPWQT